MKDNDKIRAEKLSTPAIRNILDTVDRVVNPEDTEPSTTEPLRGSVHVNGIGRITIRRLRVELEKRETQKETA